LLSSSNSRKQEDTSSEGCRVVSGSDEEANIVDSSDKESLSVSLVYKWQRKKHVMIASPSKTMRQNLPRFSLSNTEQSLPNPERTSKHYRQQAAPHGSPNDNSGML
jgi:hypothetical protein